jgi:hypothetical protein
MQILAEALKEVYVLKLGNVIFMDIENLVKEFENKDLTNEEKKTGVLAAFKLIGYDIADGAIKIGIDLAVMWIKAFLPPVV